MRSVIRALIGLVGCFLVGLVPWFLGGLLTRIFHFSYPPAAEAGWLLRLIGGVVFGAALFGSGAIIRELANANWTNRLLRWFESRLPKRSVPLDELSKAAKKDPGRVNRFIGG